MKPSGNLLWLFSRCAATGLLAAGITAPMTGCAAGAAAAPPKSPTKTGAREQVPTTIVTPEEAFTVAELYARARRALELQDAASALRDLDRVVALEPDGRFSARALLDGAEAAEHTGDRDGAVQRLGELARRFPSDPLAREALLRSARLEAFMGRWDRAGATSRALLERYEDLRPLEGIVAHGGMALERVDRGDIDGASLHVSRARDLIEQHELDGAGRLPRDLAAVYYALGEIRRLRAEQIRLAPRPADFAVRLEQRCQLVLDAQGAYSDAMRAYDARWSAMSGFRVGELYQKLHAELVGLEPPAAADSPSERLLFEGAMRLRYSVLLDKARAMMEHTLALAERTGEDSMFVERAAEAARSLAAAAERERQVLARLPYTREELETALREVERRAAARRGGGPPSAPPRR